MWKPCNILTDYVQIRAMGESIERFLNMCRHRGIVIWEIQKQEDGITGKISRSHFLNLKEICRKTKTKVVIVKKHGRQYLLFRYRKHYSFLVGLVLAAGILYVCSLYIWNISFTGNHSYTSYVLLKYLNELQVHPGIPVRQIDCDAIERSIRNQYDDVTWVSAELCGTSLIVHIKENDGSKEMAREEAACDIVADRDGLVSSIITRSGTPKVKPGDTVTKGDILVSGVVDVKDDAGTVVRQNLVRSDADVYIREICPYEEHLPKEYIYKQYTKRKNVGLLLGIGSVDIELKFPLVHFAHADDVTQTKQLRLTKSFYLPVRVGTVRVQEYEEKHAQYEEVRAQEKLYANFKEYLNNLIENKVQIVDNSVRIENSDYDYTLTGTIVMDVKAQTFADVVVPELERNEDTE